MSQLSPTGPRCPQVESLNPLRFPLFGSRLIEASAGTGKTFTIAALYIRLVLGHGGPDAYRRALTPPEILVVTFTDAATQELRDRIRARLTEAASYFRADLHNVEARLEGEDLLHDLRAEYPAEQWPGCARRLQLAAEWMDEAAVSTIHGWCNRMLREHAFDSSCLFTQTLETDPSKLLAEVVRDYWRTFLVPLEVEAVAEVLQWWPGPDVLQVQLGRLVDYADLLAAAPAPADGLHQAIAERRRRLAELKAPWTAWVGELQTLLDEARDRKAFNGQSLKKNHYDNWLQAIAAWRDDAGIVKPDLSDAAKLRLTVEGLAAIWKEPVSPQHPALKAMAALDDELKKLPDARADLLRHAARWVAERFAAEQAVRAQMGFNDLLTRLEAALRGPNGQRLADIIRHQFPVALIDEFQDTDPVQYRIFDEVYRVDDSDPETGLILIGDPKQAIYGFRGADIHTYLAARRACADRLYTLRKNFRSTAEKVAAINRVFSAAENREDGAGAFLFRGENTNPVPFIPAEAHGRNESLQIDGQPLSPLTVWLLPPADDGKALSRTAYQEQMAEVCASEIVSLLNWGQGGRTGFAADGTFKTLRPADLAVLVNGRSEADTIRGALAARGMRSVYLSDRDSVFQSPQAAEVQHWLAACAEPDNGRLLRAALATGTLNLSWSEFETINHDELAWEARVLQFRGYRECWRHRGVLPMLRRLLNDFRVPPRLLEDNPLNGERILTDILHLAELLQQASTLLDGEHALIRYLAEQRADAAHGVQGDARQIRLESDADLVKVVTVHKSKGLEYPLVFLPFACNFRATKPNDLPIKHYDEQDRLQLTLAADADLLERADRERLGEDLRKLYVALTRGRHATWVGIAPIKDLERSAFGYLLGGGLAIAPDVLAEHLDEWRSGCEHIVVIAAPAANDDGFRARDQAKHIGAARKPQREAHEPWWIASYSALGIVGEEAHAVPDTPAEDQFREAHVSPVAVWDSVFRLTAAPPMGGRLHDFPRGPEAGTFLHDLLEWAATQGFARLAADPASVRDVIARRCALRNWEQWIDPLTHWLQHFLAITFQVSGMNGIKEASFTLSGLKSSIAEMEFWLAVDRANTAQIDRLICAHTLDGAPRPALRPSQLHGMFKGFIDLVFEHDGRFYVADYKSNWLGPDDAAYTPEAMRAEILHARYELQYVLYLFALHRLLKSRLPDYDYDRHMGGAVYLFLRGLHAASQGLHAERPPCQLIESLDGVFACNSDGATA